ncbi:glycine zipper domain-containing protein [Cupriavidus respiraculi]|uniref:DUF883 domain-containing protein n=1 Tax=Cupriavidus respiraculi TaxID=195930 RepID=A0ABN7YUN0_9BURK|nr:hypothetical protein [Cupriavidus respiraculi]MBY4946349.1 hypothetical protein [Cupriavidus respiraculi]CAG9175980.1 hypothetical protein LMG21510_03025 [Cupriavidus respiraculi]
MLTRNPKVRSQVHDLADSAGNTVRTMAQAGRDTRSAARDAVAPVVTEVRGLIDQLQQTIDVLTREGSAEAAQATRRLQDRARTLADQARNMTAAGAERARERMDYAVEGVQHRVQESPLKAIAIAAAIGALIGVMCAGSSHRDQE